MTRNALSIEAVGRRANNVLLPRSIQAWDNDCWPNKVIEEQLDQREIPPQSLNSTAWVVGLVQQVKETGLFTGIDQALEQSSKTMLRGTLNQIVLHGWPIEPMAR